jgi:hypothetical protein
LKNQKALSLKNMQWTHQECDKKLFWAKFLMTNSLSVNVYKTMNCHKNIEMPHYGAQDSKF